MKRILSIVIPTYNEEDSLKELYYVLIKNVCLCIEEELITDYEIIFVDDGSSDSSVAIIRAIHQKDSRVHLISFRKNFGKAAALQAAFRNVAGDIVVTMDADLQDDPIEIKNFILKIDEGYDLVSGWKVNRLDPFEKRVPSRLFNKVTARLSGVNLHDFNCGFKAYRRELDFFCVMFLVEYAGVGERMAKILFMGMVVILNYILGKKVVFVSDKKVSVENEIESW